MAEAATLITALAGVLGIIAGLFVSRRGQKDTAAQQRTADAIAHDKLELDKTQAALAGFENLVEAQRAELTRTAERATRAEAALDNERRARDTDRAAWALLEDRCRAHTTSLVEGIALLRATLVSEIAHTAADSLLASVDPHPHDGTKASIEGPPR